MRHTALMTKIDRKSKEVISLPLETVSFRMPSLGDTFDYAVLEPEYSLFSGGGPVETIIEEEGRAGYRMILLTPGLEFILRNVEIA